MLIIIIVQCAVYDWSKVLPPTDDLLLAIGQTEAGGFCLLMIENKIWILELNYSQLIIENVLFATWKEENFFELISSSFENK